MCLLVFFIVKLSAISGIVAQRFCNFRVTIPGICQFPHIVTRRKFKFFKFSAAIKALKLNIHTKISYGWLVHALVYDLKAKKWGHLRTSLQTPGIVTPMITRRLLIFCQYLHENENILERCYVLLIHEKHQSWKILCYCPFKSHNTRPLPIIWVGTVYSLLLRPLFFARQSL